MNAPRCTGEEYIQFLIAAPRVVSAPEATRVQPRHPDAPAHDAFTRLLHRLGPAPATLWQEVAGQVARERGVQSAAPDRAVRRRGRDRPEAWMVTFVSKPFAIAHVLALVARFVVA